MQIPIHGENMAIILILLYAYLHIKPNLHVSIHQDLLNGLGGVVLTRYMDG